MLLLVLAFTAIVGTLLVGAVSTSVLQSRTMRHNLDALEAQGFAEGATDVAQKHIIDAIASYEVPPLSGTYHLGGRQVDWTATPLGPETTRTDIDGVQVISRPFDVSSRMDIDMATSVCTRIIDITRTPLYQYMIFYEGDLELQPGAEMFLEGRVHANGDVYIGSSSTLTIDADYFRATGQILRERKDTGDPTGGTVSIREYGTTDFHDLDPDADSSNLGWEQDALNTWGGTVQSGSHGVTAVASPKLKSLQDGGFYSTSAGLRIVNTTAYDSSGHPVTLPKGTITESTMYDAREGQNVTVTEIDMALLNSSGHFPANGLLYATRTDSDDTDPNGVRLKNGSELAAPLSVVSPTPVYVQGDFNTIDKKGAAVISDAVNLLSNSWDDSKGPGTLPNASDTTYNLSMVTGNVDTPDGGGDYSGGFENLPRFHENWSGRTATIRGSFAKLYESLVADSPWSYGGDIYTAPNRDWRFDTNLLDPDYLPPFTPNAVSIRRLLWDDNKQIHFKVQDSRLSLLPVDQPTYDPWTYDVDFLTKVITDPNVK